MDNQILEKGEIMRFNIVGQGNDKNEFDGILYCAQRIEEMLMMYTSHLYKTPVYNSFLLCYEFFDVYNTVEKMSVDKTHLKNIVEEFIVTFESDIVIKENFSAEKIQYFKNRLASSSIFDQQRTMHYLFHVMGDYPYWCVETLRKAVDENKGKRRIEKSVRSYIPMIIGLGYHHHFIFNTCKHIFAQPNINYSEAIEEFIATFNGGEYEYTVYFTVNEIVGKFRKILEERLNISFDQNDFSKQLCHDGKRQICVHISENAIDPYAAARKAYAAFDLFMRYYRFLGIKISF